MDDDQQKDHSVVQDYHQLNTLRSLFYLPHDLRILFPATPVEISSWHMRASRKMYALVDRIGGRLAPVES
jgi:hypothetical protein